MPVVPPSRADPAAACRADPMPASVHARGGPRKAACPRPQVCSPAANRIFYTFVRAQTRRTLDTARLNRYTAASVPAASAAVCPGTSSQTGPVSAGTCIYTGPAAEYGPDTRKAAAGEAPMRRLARSDSGTPAAAQREKRRKHRRGTANQQRVAVLQQLLLMHAGGAGLEGIPHRHSQRAKRIHPQPGGPTADAAAADIFSDNSRGKNNRHSSGRQNRKVIVKTSNPDNGTHRTPSAR